MGIRFRRSIKIAPGLKVNINKKSVGITAGVRGAHASINTKGDVTKTVGIPGSGLSYVDRHNINMSDDKTANDNISNAPDRPTPVTNPILYKSLRILLLILSVFAFTLGLLSFYPPADNFAGVLCVFISVVLFKIASWIKKSKL